MKPVRSPGKLRLEGPYPNGNWGRSIALVSEETGSAIIHAYGLKQWKANAEHLLACWNACDRLKVAELENLHMLLMRTEQALTTNPRFNAHDLGPGKLLVDIRKMLGLPTEERKY